MPSAPAHRIKEIYEQQHDYFEKIHVLPSLDSILRDEPFTQQLKEISVSDLLARHPQDLDKETISAFIKDKSVPNTVPASLFFLITVNTISTR